MAEFKRRMLTFNSGKQLKLHGNSIAISRSLEIGEGLVPNIFSLMEETGPGEKTGKVNNTYNLSPEDLMEVADYNIQLWMDLKSSIRKHGIESPKVFNQEGAK